MYSLFLAVAQPCHLSFIHYSDPLKAPKFKQSAEAIVLGLDSGLIAIYFLIQWKWDNEVVELLYVAVGIGLLSTLSSAIATLVAKAWMLLGQLMGKVTGTVLLSVVYFLILTPISKLQQVFSGKGKFKNDKEKDISAWVERKHQFVREDLNDLW